ncbi:glycerol-3-phosphate dehydrogenase [NAD(+)], cytoplasmic [Cimex lectularius]|uniref:Glycerol-3-phosphate dehydrogenase [NAD(+)] n=1 Tax=Cimex lectularius TaxID=79782 RepID=A0A8I6TF66_CIMLE|nr:glycerol-3-phosphate dehydrogenase [NAD(+)], cytoplasmic [Cimex lectularius]
MAPKKICVIGSGNWGSAIAMIVGTNAMKALNTFNQTVNMYVYEEIVDGQKLSDIINNEHENVKYLPGRKLPANVVAVPSLENAAMDADILIFVIPHQYVKTICTCLSGLVKPTTIAISLIKGFEKTESGSIELISHLIHDMLKIEVCVLMGANLANEVADGQFCETTIGCKNRKYNGMLKELFETPFFRVSIVDDAETVEICGALKNIVACAAGFCDGLLLGDNTKAAIIRLGLMEMISFVNLFHSTSRLSTFFESCGIADLVTTCYGGRNRRIAEAFVKSAKPLAVLERDMLNGQKLQGPITAEEVNVFLKYKNAEERFPLFTTVHKICIGTIKAEKLVDSLRDHPVHQLGLKSNL